MSFASLTRAPIWQRIFSVFCLVLLVGLQGLAAAPSWHRFLHHDANQTDHHCVITLLTHGTIDVPSGQIAASRSAEIFLLIPLRPVVVPTALELAFEFDRGPPSQS